MLIRQVVCSAALALLIVPASRPSPSKQLRQLTDDLDKNTDQSLPLRSGEVFGGGRDLEEGAARSDSSSIFSLLNFLLVCFNAIIDISNNINNNNNNNNNNNDNNNNNNDNMITQQKSLNS